MNVIGRLDGQVDEVIIKPVAKRNSKTSVETPADSQKPTAGAPAETQVETNSGDEEARPNGGSDLPVWLL